MILHEDGSESAYQQSLALYEDLLEESAFEPGLGEEIALAYSDLALLYSKTHQANEAMDCLRRVVSLQQRLANGLPGGDSLRDKPRLSPASTPGSARDRGPSPRGERSKTTLWGRITSIRHHQGRQEEARQWYDRATAWTKANPSASRDELSRFQTEAVRALNLDKCPVR